MTILKSSLGVALLLLAANLMAAEDPPPLWNFDGEATPIHDTPQTLEDRPSLEPKRLANVQAPPVTTIQSPGKANAKIPAAAGPLLIDPEFREDDIPASESMGDVYEVLDDYAASNGIATAPSRGSSATIRIAPRKFPTALSEQSAPLQRSAPLQQSTPLKHEVSELSARRPAERETADHGDSGRADLAIVGTRSEIRFRVASSQLQPIDNSGAIGKSVAERATTAIAGTTSQPRRTPTVSALPKESESIRRASHIVQSHSYPSTGAPAAVVIGEGRSIRSLPIATPDPPRSNGQGQVVLRGPFGHSR